MKTPLFAALLALITLSTLSIARADDVSCMDGHEEAAGKKMTAVVKQSIVKMLAKKGITLDDEKSDLEISAGTINYENDGLYGYFKIDLGSLVTKDGSDLIVEYKQYVFSIEDAQTMYLKTVLKSKGFDKEGNAIAGHCSLISDEVRVNDRAEFILVSNSHTGRTIGRVELPTKLVLY